MNVPSLANENWPRPALMSLRATGLDVAAVVEIMPGASDVAVLLPAVAECRWVLTFDREYGELMYARAVPTPPAIVYLRQEAYAPDWLAQVVRELLLRAHRVTGHLVVVTDRVLRRRPLPVP